MVFAIKKYFINPKSLKMMGKLSAILGFVVLVLSNYNIKLAVVMCILTFSSPFAWQIYHIYINNSKIQKSKILDIDMMSGIDFENFLKQLFSCKGYKVKSTPASGDNGADLILEKGRKRIVVQAKRYSKPVGVKAIQEVNSSIKVYNANEAWVVTNNEYTKAAIYLAKVNQVHLISRKQLINLITNSNLNSINKPNLTTFIYNFILKNISYREHIKNMHRKD